MTCELVYELGRLAGDPAVTWRAIVRVASMTVASMMIATNTASAYDAVLAWYPVVGAAGYRVYTRETGQTYGSGTNVGSIPPGVDGIIRYRKTGLRPDRTTYFAIACYNGAGANSPLSNELSLSPPASPTPRGTATPKPTATPCNPSVGGGCAPPGAMVITRARLQQDTSPSRDNGRLRLQGSVNDADASGLIEPATADGMVTITIRDAGQFTALLSLTDCRSTAGSIRCQTADGRGTVRFKRVRRAEFLYSLTLEIHHLSGAETGPDAPSGPVSVTLHEGPGVDRVAVIDSCRPPSNRSLLCTVN